MNLKGIEAFNHNSPNSIKDIFNMGKASSSDFMSVLNEAVQKTEKTDTFVSAEQSLKDIYPDLKYHVLDASQFTYWNRNDFPASGLFEDTIDVEGLKSWKPDTSTATGYEPWVQKDLEKIQKGLQVVFIHPATQEKMDKDPEYAKQIAEKIRTYFEQDIRINEAIDPESVGSMSQAVTITEDGEIGLHVTVCDGPVSTGSASIEPEVKDSKVLQQLINKLPGTSLSYPEEKAQTVTWDYDYRYFYAFLQKRKEEKISSLG